MHSNTLCLVILVAASLVSCGGSDELAAGDIHFMPNQGRYALPLDQFAGDNDIVVSDYAQNLLIQPCMESAGYQWPVPVVDTEAPPGATANSVGRRLFDARIAARFGYHTAPPTQPNAVRMNELNSRSLSAGELSALEVCRSQAQRQVPPQPQGSEFIATLGVEAYEAAKVDQKTLESAGRWRECMKPQGISDLPDVPSKMPSMSLARRYKLLNETAGPRNLSGAPTASEIRVAVADARCRASSGYAMSIYEEEVAKQLELIARNRDALDRAKTANVSHDRQIRSVIARSNR